MKQNRSQDRMWLGLAQDYVQQQALVYITVEPLESATRDLVRKNTI